MVQTLYDQQTLSILVRDREGILFEGEAESVSSVNETGKFDVLALHANFISIINEYITLRTPDGITKTIPLRIGIIKVRENLVEVYLGILH
ncbi:MAG: hypothetical protein A3H69_04840 [Candidatus Sungbacteria bacterium RIFCSPLOWO2_02_FULL_47_9]|uniref:ATP synthase F1 complex delta/epsilon subunit N-terminal domain-containing protein n=1 Tax=Candidatus Sungbacteria bacterium RIFCSPHIGHO2_01_FULL_47_32 TaxID=1802264 RepID=A0A1G2K3W3_9BACT|nr:MAG: hypothetical protein UX72_C0027G0010 [Parcubacteria group bacterium GW2011_GWA2_47_10]OGZ94097.1 MAG: hypothetical protein A2633_03995 [Candidatus Sungbacteria bacterium RIFCSPHIGHO2_01_FULL_47_32]OGZ98532.1 MAG: hypothetical protein A3D57_00190 [Candidatus Sungbacteria bacterium RIFCSPHIGHO2_02_FULL_46_12]OHA05265.1 MAG: hypothetical protein A3A28_01610 [Candidatus Sungbacteria bacterium RIFCSPLOWO2_01_FULL_47_32]OHA10864.1 MAG: hypothetical protein A3H69_04840 [Candidatus Sungbacteria